MVVVVGAGQRAEICSRSDVRCPRPAPILAPRTSWKPQRSQRPPSLGCTALLALPWRPPMAILSSTDKSLCGQMSARMFARPHSVQWSKPWLSFLQRTPQRELAQARARMARAVPKSRQALVPALAQDESGQGQWWDPKTMPMQRPVRLSTE